MNEPNRWNYWIIITVLMALVFAGAGIWFTAAGGFTFAAAIMFVIAVHSALAAWMYYRWPQYANNMSNMTQFINNTRMVLIWGGFGGVVDLTSPYMLFLLVLAFAIFCYLSFQSGRRFFQEIRGNS